MTPEKAEQLQKEAMDLFNGETVGFPGGKGFQRAVLFAACSKAMNLALQIEALQPSSVFYPVNHLWKLAGALQAIDIAGTADEPAERKRADKKFEKALAGWNAYLNELPVELEKDRKLFEGVSESRLGKVVNALFAEKAAPAKKMEN